ncbi:hypothetical protein HAX54_047442 [Datura stramonium]|uniref:Uncharacterized protein n=1 Tax=Datura stramonium TaxID=4076 RepID=A0ABS8WI89_DATST|nr:hypothetical protein [Datura stramonium]
MKAGSTRCNDKATAVLSGSGSCTDQDYEREEESSGNVSISKATFINRDENDLLEEEHTVFDAVLPEFAVSSSGSSLFVENNSSFPVEGDQTQNKEVQVKMEVYSSHLEGSVHTRNEERFDSTTAQQLESSIGVEDLKNTNEMKAESAHCIGKESAVLSGSCSFTDQEYGRKKESFVSTSQATSIDRDENDLLKEDHMLFDSVLPEYTVSSSKSSLSFENNSSFPVGEDQAQSNEDKKLLCPSTTLMPGEVVRAVGHHDNNVLQAVTKHGSGTKFQNADKPKRRLLPVSSILLKDIGSLNFKDENEKPKGVKAEKKGASVENRTQGSISLLRLLKDNLAI